LLTLPRAQTMRKVPDDLRPGPRQTTPDRPGPAWAARTGDPATDPAALRLRGWESGSAC